MPDVSPTKWHRAHTTWFFETFLLMEHLEGYAPVHPAFGYLYNSYYEAVGARHPRAERGLLSRPSLQEVANYRRIVDEAMSSLLSKLDDEKDTAALNLVELGLHHEQQHQELLLMDIKHVLSVNPTDPAYHSVDPPTAKPAPPLGWSTFEAGAVAIGHVGEGFAFDNECPRHEVLVGDYALANRLVTCGEWAEFMEADGYRRADLWLSEGWHTVQTQGWDAPLYWGRRDGSWHVHTLGGVRPVNPAEPVSHISYFEADAFARWAGARLPREAEWERAAADITPSGNFAEDGLLHPAPASDAGLTQLFGDLWEWTASPYVGYPGFAVADGAVGEYNGKFMINQMVLRGGAAVTPADHIRCTYRNFFPPHSRWMFSGLRLAKDVA
jgi:ergothioneine biosynthesis protein EgtB